MKRLIAPMPLVLMWLLLGCHSSAKRAGNGDQGPSVQADAGPVSSRSTTLDAGAPAPMAPLKTEAMFSAPIAGMRLGSSIIVAGLVANAGLVRVIGLRDGRAMWTTDAIRGVAWTPNAELTMQPAADGVAVIWRGQGDGHASVDAGTLVILGPQGDLRGDPIAVGAAVCTTGEGLAWIDLRNHEAAHVLARRFSEASARDAVVLPLADSAALACGDHRVFVLGEGDDAVSVTSFVPGDPAPRAPDVALRDSDFADEEKDHRFFTAGDHLHIVRAGDEGVLAMRDIPPDGAPGAWHKLKHTLTADDDIVSVDATDAAWFIVFAQDAEDACPGVTSGGEKVHALRIDRVSGAEAVTVLAPRDCTHSVGPFWIANAPPSVPPAPSSSLVAWVERTGRATPEDAPISGLVYRRIDSSGIARAGRVNIDTDALAAAGCDADRCLAVALVRDPGDRGGQRPMAIVALSYP